MSEEKERTQSYFDGKFWPFLGWTLLAGLIISVSLGIAAPWAVCMLNRWYCKHKVVNGRRMMFDGKGGELFGKYIIWFLLSIVTLGIYSFVAAVKLVKWEVEHIHFEDAPEESVSMFDGKFWPYWGWTLLAGLIASVSFGIAAPWAVVMLDNYLIPHQVIDGKRLTFDGKGGQLFGKYIIWFLLTIVTFGIYGLVLPIKMLRWETEHMSFEELEAPQE